MSGYYVTDSFLPSFAAYDLAFCPLEDTKSELWSIDTDTTMFLLANRYDRTNILFKYSRDPDD